MSAANHRQIRPIGCPFCGEIPDVLPFDPKRDGGCWGEVRCVNANCHAKPVVRDSARLNTDCGSAAYKEIAIRHWNRRVS